MEKDKPTEKVSAEQRAERIYLGLVMWISTETDRKWRDNILRGITSEIEQAVQLAEREAREEGFEAGMKAWQMNGSEAFKAGAEAMREMAAEGAYMKSPCGDSGHEVGGTIVYCSSALRRIIRALPLPSDTTAGKE